MASSSRYLALLANRSPSGPDCYVCLQIAQRKPIIQEGPTTTCLLCNNPYCETHKGHEDGTCNINHVTYYGKTKHRARHAPVEIFPSIEARKRRFGGDGFQTGGAQEEDEGERTTEGRAEKADAGD